MSIKTFPGREGSSFLIFLILSALMHAGIWGALRLVPTGGPVPSEIKRPPILVDVVDLPPAKPSGLSPVKKPSTHGAQRDESVKKESWPEPAPRALSPARSVQPPLVQPEKPATKEQKATGSAGAMKESAVGQPGTADLTAPAGPVEEPIRAEAPRKESESPKGGVPARPKAAEPLERPSLFPTDERISELAKKYEANAPKGEVGKTLSLNTSELKYQKYLMDMKTRIEFYWEYPSLAARNGWQGNLRINFRINRDGSVSDVSLERSSGYPMLDDAAMTAVRLAAPFPPFPGNFTVEDLNIKGLFTYHLITLPMERQ